MIDAKITREGAGYIEAPIVRIVGGGGAGAEAVAILTAGRITSIKILNAGSGYTSKPSITIDPPSTTTNLSIRMPLQLMLKGEQSTEAVIEATETLTGPWTEWRTVVVGENGMTEVDLDEGAEQRFYRIRR